MATYTAAVRWALKDGEDFARGRYSRGHELSFDGGATVAASASPHVVGKWAVDPEEMLVAALSDCHMLTFCTSPGSPVSGFFPIKTMPKA